MVESVMWGAVAPLILSLISNFWHYPAPLEELVKWLILSNLGGGVSVRRGLAVGLSFGLSEAVLFSLLSWTSGMWSAMILRLLLTVPMHALTSSMTAWGISRRMGYVGLGGAMVIHALFNATVTMF